MTLTYLDYFQDQMRTFKFLSNNIPSIDLNLQTINVQGGVRPLRAQWRYDFEQDSSDIPSYVTDILSQQLAEEIDREILQQIRENTTMFPIAQRLTARTFANDLVSVQSLNAPTMDLFYIDFKKSLRDFKFFKGW